MNRRNVENAGCGLVIISLLLNFVWLLVKGAVVGLLLWALWSWVAVPVFGLMVLGFGLFFAVGVVLCLLCGLLFGGRK